MNKKLFIFMFLIMASPVFADDNPFRDDVINELPPSLSDVKPAVETKTTFSQKVKNFFSKSDNNKSGSAKEVNIIEPSEEYIKTIESVEKEQKKAAKELKKQQKKAEKAAKKAKKAEAKNKNSVNANSQRKEAEAPAVNTGNDTTVLTDTAYQGSINTTEIISVDNCVKLALEHHPAIHVAMSNAEIYESKIAQAWANYFPTLSAGLSYSRNDMQMSNFVFPVQEYDMFYVPTVSANMLLFDFGKTKAQADYR